MASEEAKVIEAENSTEVLTAFNRIPYALINAEVKGAAKDTLDELTQICKYYKVYKKGASFTIEGTNGDYIPAKLKYKMAASLINKEARFLFAEPPDITVEPKGDVGKITEDAKNALTVMNDLVKTILDANKFEEALIKAAKDCFIGKRVAGLINFNEDDGVTVTFLPSTQFIYETKIGNPNVLTKFVCFIIVKDSIALTEKRIFKKKFELIDDVVYLEEVLYDGAGKELEVVTEYQETLIPMIPASIFINDGLTGEESGESEIEILQDDESWYSKLSNADIDAQRKSMNPTKYTIDMESNSTKNLSTAAGALWDLGSDQNLDKPHPAVGMLEPSMSYSTSLDTTLKRVKKSAYNQVDMPDIEEVQATITSGKALKAIYWPLIVRCKEKMKMWGPQLRQMVNIIIQGAMVYPNCIERYINDVISPVAYEISIIGNLPIPEDEIEEKNMDLAEVESKTMSRKAYMKKWRQLTDDEVQEELEQIALERQIIEDSSFSSSGGTLPYGNGNPNPIKENSIEEESEPLEDEEEIPED
ncbi:MAG: phage portal protein, partial [Bacteroidales bacterium]|nr:phage portal protein [Bacteroidales bacterium]